MPCSAKASPTQIYRGHQPSPKNLIWKYTGEPCNHYQVEHDLLFEAIRHDKPYNEAERCADAALVGIMGRMAAESGKLVTWDEALHSKIELAPGLDKLTMNSPPPVKPDAEGELPHRHAGVHDHGLSGLTSDPWPFSLLLAGHPTYHDVGCS